VAAASLTAPIGSLASAHTRWCCRQSAAHRDKRREWNVSKQKWNLFQLEQQWKTHKVGGDGVSDRSDWFSCLCTRDEFFFCQTHARRGESSAKRCQHSIGSLASAKRGGKRCQHPIGSLSRDEVASETRKAG